MRLQALGLYGVESPLLWHNAVDRIGQLIVALNGIILQLYPHYVHSHLAKVSFRPKGKLPLTYVGGKHPLAATVQLFL